MSTPNKLSVVIVEGASVSCESYKAERSTLDRSVSRWKSDVRKARLDRTITSYTVTYSIIYKDTTRREYDTCICDAEFVARGYVIGGWVKFSILIFMNKV